MHWTVEFLLWIIRERKTSGRKVVRDAGIAVNTITRWKKQKREPEIDTIDKALNAVGYRLAIVPLDYNGDKEPMNRTKLQIAVDEARRFISRAEALPAPEPYQHHITGSELLNDYFPREQGAIKRASMDLTRALADLRKVDR